MTSSIEVRTSALGRIVVPVDLSPGVFLFYTTVDFDGRLNAESVAKLDAIVQEATGRSSVLATCHQVHGTSVTAVTSTAAKWCESESCDALYTRESGVALGIKVADCLPVTLVDPASNWTANIHAGWRGAAARIVEQTLSTASAGDVSSDGIAVLGPTIRQCCFEVGEEVIGRFEEAYGNVDAFVDRSKAKPHFSVAGVITRSLAEAGFAPQNIFDTKLCTRCDGSIFHSYRRNGKNAGRNLAIVAR